jgi:Xaa-Pro aminopeptidase
MPLEYIFRNIWKKNKGIDAFFITSPYNIGFLCDFWGSYGKLLITKKKAFLITDSRYFLGAKSLEENSLEIIEKIKRTDFWEKILQEHKIKTLGIESEHVSVFEYEKMQKHFGKGIQIKKTNGVIEKIRIEKNEDTLKKIALAAHIADQTLEKTLSLLSEGKTERGVWRRRNFFFYDCCLW